jgi:hypothetical protein
MKRARYNFIRSGEAPWREESFGGIYREMILNTGAMAIYILFSGEKKRKGGGIDVGFSHGL